MIPKRWIEVYLRFLLRNRLAVGIAISLMTVFFAYEATKVKIVPQFLDFYPGPSTVRLFGHEYTWRKGHPYITIYNTFRRMFGSANVLTVILEVKQGDIYNPTTLQKLDLITKRLVETKGVVPYQVGLQRAAVQGEQGQAGGHGVEPRPPRDSREGAVDHARRASAVPVGGGWPSICHSRKR